MSRCVFDTNVIVSALISDTSVPALSFLRALDQGSIFLTSGALLEELGDVLARPRFDRYFSLLERVGFLRAFITEAELVTVNETIQVCRDPKDDRVLETAISGRAEFIVTGDNDLLALNPFRGVQILSPSQFLSLSR